MQLIRPLGFFKCFFASANWKLILGDDNCVIRGRDSTAINYLSVEEVTLKGKRFPTLLLRTKDAEFNLKWLGLFSANKKKNALDRKQQQAQERAIEIFYQSDRYISNRDFCRWRDSIPQGSNQFFKRAYVGLPERNEEYVRREMTRFCSFFDTVENQPLTDEQRWAAVVMEDRNLLIAAAGSGKTSAIVGKVGYILEKGIVPPSQILALAFNKNAAEEMQERLVARLRAKAEGITVNTFHKYGYDVIARNERAKPSVPSWVGGLGGNTYAHEEWRKLLESIADKDDKFGDALASLFTYFRWATKPLHLFKSKSEYEQHILSLGAKNSRGNDGGHWGAPTINGEYVLSLQELQIANWLYINGIEYQYEKPYEHEVATAELRQYKPDFYYPQIGVYHEHFALDENGKAPTFFHADYAREAQRKRDLHARHGTQLIETTSAMFQSKDVFDYLKQQLQARGVVFKRRAFGEVIKKLRKQIILPLYGTMHTFLAHWKSSGLSEDEMLAQIKTAPGFERMREKLFLHIMIRIRREYDAKLRAANEIDYEDMLVKAEEILRLDYHHHPYNMILVDEFQDISRSRARLIKTMLSQNPDCKMFAVGDDWQAIYRFAGSDITVMTGFSEVFGETAKSRLEKTFRSNQGIANVAAGFVSKNPSQEQKQVRAEDGVISGVVQVVNYFSSEGVESFIAQKLHELSGGKPARVRILARYNRHKPKHLSEWQKEFRATLDIKFSTIHSAKGQEADYVFVLGMNSGQYGFPNEMEDDPVLQLVMPKREEYAYAEERRLFYVALTRARHKVFLLANKQRRSRFVDEISAGYPTSVYENDIGKDGEPIPSVALPKCPRCGGVLRQRESHYGKDFMGCSNSPKCRYQESLPSQK